MGAIGLRSDVERKRRHGLAPQDRRGDAVGAGLYSDQATLALYHHLAALARQILAAGWPVIIDAAFLRRRQRDLLRGVAREAGVSFLFTTVTAPEAVLRARIAVRAAAGSDPSDAGIPVLEHQLATREALAADETDAVIGLSSAALDPAAGARQVIAALAAMRDPA